MFDPPWWDAAWNHRWPIVVTNHSTSSLGAGFQLPLPVVDGTGPVAAIDTWRVLYWNGGTWDDLPRVVEHVGDTAWVWFRTREQIDASTTGEGYWLYTGNPGAAVPPFADGVFEFYSAVDPIDSAKWATIGNVSTDGGMAKLDGSGAGASIRSLTTFEVRSVVEFAMIVDAPVASGGWWFCGGFQRQNDFTNSSPWILWISRSGTQLDTEFYNGSGISWKGANVGIDPGVEHLYGIERFRRKLVFRRDHQDFETYTFGSEYTTPLQIRFSAYADSVIRLRWARVRRARDPAPTATLGAPESLP